MTSPTKGTPATPGNDDPPSPPKAITTAVPDRSPPPTTPLDPGPDEKPDVASRKHDAAQLRIVLTQSPASPTRSRPKTVLTVDKDGFFTRVRPASPVPEIVPGHQEIISGDAQASFNAGTARRMSTRVAEAASARATAATPAVAVSPNRFAVLEVHDAPASKAKTKPKTPAAIASKAAKKKNAAAARKLKKGKQQSTAQDAVASASDMEGVEATTTYAPSPLKIHHLKPHSEPSNGPLPITAQEQGRADNGNASV
jgi:hypothetical protein